MKETKEIDEFDKAEELELHIGITIKDYENFEHNTTLITLIDNEIIDTEENICDKDNIMVRWSRSPYSKYDYVCVLDEINNNFDIEMLRQKKILKYIKNKFDMIQSSIKNTYSEFGELWKINYSIDN